MQKHLTRCHFSEARTILVSPEIRVIGSLKQTRYMVCLIAIRKHLPQRAVVSVCSISGAPVSLRRRPPPPPFLTARGHKGGRTQTGDGRESATAPGLHESPSCPRAQSRGRMTFMECSNGLPGPLASPESTGGERAPGGGHCLAPSPLGDVAVARSSTKGPAPLLQPQLPWP